MTKKMLTMMAALLLSGSAIAAPVDATSAKEKAAAFLKKQAQHSTNSRRAAALRNPQLTEAQAFGNALHVFNVGGDNGFVIVSGDDRTEEILGYVDGGTFDYNNIPDNMRFWLQMYADEINSLGGRQVQQAPRRETRANIEPLMTTDWDQRDSYNDKLFFDCPEMLGSNYPDDVYTGCAATSMAQALYQAAQQYKKKHGEWPSNQTTQIPAYNITASNASGKINYQKEMPALDPIVFDWKNMRNNYTDEDHATEEEINAVATLMTYCGRAMHMEYGTSSSDAAFVYMPFRMAAYFGIQPYVKNMDRQYYTSQVWEDLLYNELTNGRAVPYTGVINGPSSSNPGHAFILDGYKDGLWHFNWGWGMGAYNNNQVYNGYYSLSALKPTGSGSVSGATLGYDFIYLQQATIGVSFDPVEGVANTCYTHIGGSRGYSSSTTEVTYLNYNVQGGVYTLDGAWAIDNGNGNFTILKKDYENRLFNRRTTDDYGEYGDLASYTQYIDELPVTGIADGTYTVLHVSSLAGENNWVADDGTDLMNFTVEVSNGRIQNVICHPTAFDRTKLSVVNIETIGDMKANENNIVRVTIQNDGDDFWGKLSMYYNTDNEPVRTRHIDFNLAPIKPGLSTHDFTVNLPKGIYNLWFFANGDSYQNPSNAFGTGQIYIGMGDLNLVTVDNVVFDGLENDALSVRSVNGTLDEVTGSFDVTNGQANQAYSNSFFINVELGNRVYKTSTIPVSVPAGQTVNIPFTVSGVTGLTSGQTYKLRIYRKSDQTEIDVASKNMTLDSWYRYWKTDGTEALAQELSTMDATAKADAAAIDYRYINTLKKADNPNCLYYLSAANSSLDNGIVDNIATSVVVNNAYPFYAPESFSANEISFTKTFTNGVDKETKKPYWETIVLPFKVNNVKQGTKNLKWFKSVSDTRCHFWLMELTNVTSDALTFDYAQTFEANTPYIIQVPGEGWGDSWNLAGKELTFKGLNVNVPVTAFSNETFIGTYASLTTSGLFLDASKNRFLLNEAGTVAPYNAYINAPSNANAMRIVIGDGEDIATGIMDVETGEVTIDQVYDLQGRRVQNPKKGLYIVNGKTVVIK